MSHCQRLGRGPRVGRFARRVWWRQVPVGARDGELQVQGERGITGDYRSDRGDNEERVLQPLQAAPAPK